MRIFVVCLNLSRTYRLLAELLKVQNQLIDLQSSREINQPLLLSLHQIIFQLLVRKPMFQHFSYLSKQSFTNTSLGHGTSEYRYTSLGHGTSE